MCAGKRYPYVAKITILLKQCVPCVLKFASIIQNKPKIRFCKYQKDCLINKKYIVLFRVFLYHPLYYFAGFTTGIIPSSGRGYFSTCLFAENIYLNERVSQLLLNCYFLLFIPPANFVCGGHTVFTLSVRACVCVCVRPCVRPSVRPSVRNVLFP